MGCCCLERLGRTIRIASIDLDGTGVPVDRGAATASARSRSWSTTAVTTYRRADRIRFEPPEPRARSTDRPSLASTNVGDIIEATRWPAGAVWNPPCVAPGRRPGRPGSTGRRRARVGRPVDGRRRRQVPGIAARLVGQLVTSWLIRAVTVTAAPRMPSALGCTGAAGAVRTMPSTHFTVGIWQKSWPMLGMARST